MYRRKQDKHLGLHIDACNNAAIDMTKLLRLFIVFLLFRIDWRKLIVACSVLMIVSVLIQISKLPYPLIGNDSPSDSAISSFNSLNTSVNLDKSLSLAGDGVHIKSVKDAPTNILLSSSAKMNRSLIAPNKKSRPPPPRMVKKLPSQLEVIWLWLSLVMFIA